MDEGHDCILTITDRVGADLRLIECNLTMSAEDLALAFFNNWYCENGLPLNMFCDRDKLFMSRFWKALTKLTGVKMNMSSAYHPQTDGSSERTNKTLNQALRYHVKRNQHGWVKALPRIRFAIMNTVNAATGFSNFQLHLGRSPRVIPPIVPNALPVELGSAATRAEEIIQQINDDVDAARDNLMLAKVFQAHNANENRGPEVEYKINDLVMLSTTNRRQMYKKKGEKRAAKFFPRWDGPYRITAANPATSSYTLDMGQQTNVFPTFHSSQLKPHKRNDAELFPAREMPRPGPVVTADGLQEHEIDHILDARKRGKGWQFLIRWYGYGPEDDEWLPARNLEDCEALDKWYAAGGDGPAAR